jgi:hypothetical protein
MGSIVRLPGASSERQKYLRDQTESLQRRERRIVPRTAVSACSDVGES